MNVKKQAIVVLSPGFASGENDSSCLPAQQVFFKELRQQLSSTEVIILGFQYPYFVGEYTHHGCHIISFNGQTRGGLFHLWLWLKIWRRFHRLTNEFEIKSLLCLWCGECALVGKFLSRVYKLKMFCWILGQDAKADNHFVRKIRPAQSELIAMSAFLRNEFARNHKISPFHLVENSIDLACFVPGGKEKVIDVFCAGSLIALKQYDIAIEILAAIKCRFPMIRVVICGKGPQEQQLRRMVTERGLASNVHLIGEQPHPEVIRLMQSSRIFLHPSSYEGFSSACLEALQAGMHVVSFCEPMEVSVKHWHVVQSRTEMKDKLVSLLTSPALDHAAVTLFDVRVKARQMKKILLN